MRSRFLRVVPYQPDALSYALSAKAAETLLARDAFFVGPTSSQFFALTKALADQGDRALAGIAELLSTDLIPGFGHYEHICLDQVLSLSESELQSLFALARQGVRITLRLPEDASDALKGLVGAWEAQCDLNLDLEWCAQGSCQQEWEYLEFRSIFDAAEGVAQHVCGLQKENPNCLIAVVVDQDERRPLFELALERRGIVLSTSRNRGLLAMVNLILETVETEIEVENLLGLLAVGVGGPFWTFERISLLRSHLKQAQLRSDLGWDLHRGAIVHQLEVLLAKEDFKQKESLQMAIDNLKPLLAELAKFKRTASLKAHLLALQSVVALHSAPHPLLHSALNAALEGVATQARFVSLYAFSAWFSTWIRLHADAPRNALADVQLLTPQQALGGRFDVVYSIDLPTFASQAARLIAVSSLKSEMLPLAIWREPSFEPTRLRDDDFKVGVDSLQVFSKYLGLSSQKPITPTRIESFAQCRFRAFVEKILGVETQPGNGVDLDGRILGRLVHAVLESFFLKRRGQTYADILASEWHSEVDRLVEERKQQLCPYPSYPHVLVQAQAHYLALMLKRCISNLLKQEAWPTQLCPVSLEERVGLDGDPVPFVLGDHTIFMGGIVDRVDEDSTTRLVLDYKLSSTQRVRQMTKADAILESHFQLPIYLWLLEQKRPTPHSSQLCAALVSVRDGTLGPILGQEVFTDARQKLLGTGDGSLKERLEAVLLPLYAGDFRPNPSSACDTCHLGHVCRVKEGGAAQ